MKSFYLICWNGRVIVNCLRKSGGSLFCLFFYTLLLLGFECGCKYITYGLQNSFVLNWILQIMLDVVTALQLTCVAKLQANFHHLSAQTLHHLPSSSAESRRWNVFEKNTCGKPCFSFTNNAQLYLFDYIWFYQSRNCNYVSTTIFMVKVVAITFILSTCFSIITRFFIFVIVFRFYLFAIDFRQSPISIALSISIRFLLFSVQICYYFHLFDRQNSITIDLNWFSVQLRWLQPFFWQFVHFQAALN